MVLRAGFWVLIASVPDICILFTLFSVAKKANEGLGKEAYGLQNCFPNLNTVEGPQYWKQQKTVVTILCSEKSKVMICLPVKLSIIGYAVKNTRKSTKLSKDIDLKSQRSDMVASHKQFIYISMYSC